MSTRQRPLSLIGMIAFSTLTPLFFASQGALAAADPQPPATESLGAQVSHLPWVHGPSTLRIDGNSDLKIPAGYEALPPPHGKRFLALIGNLVSERDDRDYILQPEARDKDWFMDFSYADSGHVDDTDQIDAGKLLDGVREHSIEENKERREAHLAELNLLGWQTPPHYDQQLHRLEWAYKFKSSEGDLITNLNTRVLTRTGYYRVLMVGDVETYATDRQEFNQALTSIPGNRYSDYKTGDKMAKYGLMGLIGGGAAAIAVKTGLVGAAIAFIVKIGSALLGSKAMVAVIGAFAVAWKGLKGFFSRKKEK